jgi:photosystem II stability/assembly factor-like uncharacterized protein
MLVIREFKSLKMRTKLKKYGLIVGIPMTIIMIVMVFFSIKPHKINFEGDDEEKHEKEGFDKPEGFNQFYQQITTPIGQTESGYKTNYAYFELKKALQKKRNLKLAQQTYSWVQRGPGNVGGRTRSIIIDPDDASHNTWFAAAVSGGIWKTTNGGQSWQCLTDQLPDLATTTLAMASSDHNVIYAGTGEGYGAVGMVVGKGIYKSLNRGNTWDVLGSTVTDKNFQFVNKIIVDRNNANILIAATNSGIFKSLDGGNSWNSKYLKGNAVQDLAINPLNPNTIYAAVNSLGIVKSFDNGNNWFASYKGIGTGKRFSLAASPVDSNYVFTSVEAPNMVTNVYISIDGGNSWRKLYDYDNTFINFLGVQGWFNNVIKPHPFNKNKVFVGGVNYGSIEFKSVTSTSAEQVLRVDTFGTTSFMEFVKFGGQYFDGAMSTGTDEGADVLPEDFVSVEIRFGPGISQKAYRFVVPAGEGAGVPPEDYTYMNYINVPFQAWDTKNNRQLMVSFRDQERDGKFNLILRPYGDDISGREYFYVHAIKYNIIPDTSIAKNGGNYHKMLYFFWPTLPEDKTWNENALPNSKISVQYGTYTLQNASTTILADSTRNVNLHVDHHDLGIVVTDPVNYKFTMIDANDGGLGISIDSGSSWEQIKNGYITTQFYGVAKKPGAEEYIGGMQDNGTWQSPLGEISNSSSEFTLRITGDGFEALWNSRYPQRILGSTYYNGIKLTMDGGENWTWAIDGINGDGPFLTRLSNSNKNPNLVFAVGNKGVYRHTNFGVGRFPWNLIEPGNGWAVNDLVTSSHNVKVSLADPKIVWAGAGMYSNPDLRIFLSKDYGLTFDSVRSYTGKRQMGYITSIATHPTDTATAYLLFSESYRPKILRTTNYGETWQDISGFGDDSTSNNGFPDVMVYSLLVMPDNTNIIWAGTEIGIFESTNAGGSWHYADNGLPAVSVWQMFIQDNAIVVATHGRGIWSASIYPTAVVDTKISPEMTMKVFPNPTTGIINLSLLSGISGNLSIRILDETGRSVHIFQDFKGQTSYEKQIDLSDLAPGNYIVNMICNGMSYSSKIIVK